MLRITNLFKFYILFCILLISDTDIAYGQAGIRAQGRDVDQTQRGQGAQNLLRSMLNINHRQEMRKFIRNISAFGRRLDPNFIIITQDGLELLEKTNSGDDEGSSPSRTYIQSIDGVLIKGLNFRPPVPGKDDIKTDAKIRKELLRLAKMGKKRGLGVWVSDYAPNKEIAKDIVILNKANNFVPFAAQSLDDPVPYSFPATTTKSFPLFLYSIAASYTLATFPSGYILVNPPSVSGAISFRILMFPKAPRFITS